MTTEPAEISETVEVTYEPAESSDGGTPASEYGDGPVEVVETAEVYFDKEM